MLWWFVLIYARIQLVLESRFPLQRFQKGHGESCGPFFVCFILTVLCEKASKAFPRERVYETATVVSLLPSFAFPCADLQSRRILPQITYL